MATTDLGDLKPVYLIYGDEELLLRARGPPPARAAVQGRRPRLQLRHVRGRVGATSTTILAAANTLPFMSEKRLVVVRDVDRMPTAALGALADYAADPSEQTVLVLVARKIAQQHAAVQGGRRSTGRRFE